MGALAAVVGDEADEDGLSAVGAEVEAHGGPVFPQHLVGGLMPLLRPACRIAYEGGVRYEVGHAAGVDELVVLVEDLQPEAGLQFGRVLGVLQHGGIAHDEEVEAQGVDKETVGDGFGLGAVGVGTPVAQADAGGAAGGNGAQQAAGARVVLGGVVADGVAAVDAQAAIVDGAGVVVGVAEGATGEEGVGRREVGGVDAS